MHRLRRTTLPDRFELDPPPSADHSTWIVGQRARPRRRGGLAPPTEIRPLGAVRDCFWVTRLL